MARFAALLLMTVTAAIEARDVPDYADWYQIEIIVFAQRSEPAGGESWPVETLDYPPSIVTLGAADTAPGPQNLGQLRQLLESAVAGESLSETATASEDDFLFGNRSRFHQRPLPNELVDQASPGEDATGQRPAQPVDLDAILSPGLPKAFEVIDTGERNLNSIARSVSRSSRYRLLLHTAWRQPVYSTEESLPILLQTGERYGDLYEVDGTLTISRSRYLHVDANLWFTRFTRRYEHELPMPEIVAEIDPQALQRYPELLEAERERGNFIAVDRHRMNISRRMRRSTLHFLDNPWFGVLVQIEKFDFEPPDIVAEVQ